MKGTRTQASLDGFGMVKSRLEVDVMTMEEILKELELERQDPLLSPWTKGYKAAIRTALGH